MNSCGLIMHPCIHCKREFLGSWQERVCKSCLDNAQRVRAREYYWRKKEMSV